MKTLIRLELRKTNFRTYVISTIIISMAMLGFLYLFAYAPMLEPTDADMAIFLGYENLIPLYGVLNMTSFSILSAVMYSKLIIEDYSGKRPILLFSYPISRKKIILSKLCIVCIFTIISMVISNFIIFMVFGISECFLHILKEKFTILIMIQAIENTFIMSLIAVSIGVIAVGIGFIKKSIPTTIISAVLISSLTCNIVANTTSNKGITYAFAILMIIVCGIFIKNLVKKIDDLSES